MYQPQQPKLTEEPSGQVACLSRQRCASAAVHAYFAHLSPGMEHTSFFLIPEQHSVLDLFNNDYILKHDNMSVIKIKSMQL